MRSHMRRTGASLVLVGLLIGGSAQAAVNLVNNGDFESGDFTGWTLAGSATDPLQYLNFGVDDLSPHSGTYGAFFGLVGAAGGIQQTVATTAGTNYQVDFWLKSETDVTGATGGNTFQFSWGGTVQTITLSPVTDSYQHYMLNLKATSNATLLDFSMQNDKAFWDLDDVSVTASVPEPGQLAMLSLGLGIVGVALRRRQRS